MAGYRGNCVISSNIALPSELESSLESVNYRLFENMNRNAGMLLSVECSQFYMCLH